MIVPRPRRFHRKSFIWLRIAAVLLLAGCAAPAVQDGREDYQPVGVIYKAVYEGLLSTGKQWQETCVTDGQAARFESSRMAHLGVQKSLQIFDDRVQKLTRNGVEELSVAAAERRAAVNVPVQAKPIVAYWWPAGLTDELQQPEFGLAKLKQGHFRLSRERAYLTAATAHLALAESLPVNFSACNFLRQLATANTEQLERRAASLASEHGATMAAYEAHWRGLQGEVRKVVRLISVTESDVMLMKQE